MAEKAFVIENGVLVSYKGRAKEVEIPADVDRIGAGAFKNNSKLEKVTFLGKKLKSIDENAFYGCVNLKGAKLPDGLVQIGDYAFLGCENMEYIYIPSSVVMIGKHIVESKVTVLGSTDSEAEKYAKSGHLAFKTNFEAFIHSLEQTHIAQNNVETKTFDIFGEKITVSNSLARYHDIIEYYTGRKEPLYETMLSYVYNMGDKSKKYDPNGALDELKKAAVKRLEKSGIFIAETRFLYIIEPMKAILEVYKAASTAYVELAKGVSEDIESKADMLYSQAESQVTGLSYGYIGDSFGLAVYGIDDFLTKQRQRKKAYAQANSQMNAFKEQHIAKGKEIYREFCDKIAPFLHIGVSAYVDAVCKTEIEYYISNKLIDAEIIDAYDVEKSTELVQGLYSKLSPNPEFVIALALKKYPMNMAAHIYAIRNKFACDGLYELWDFLGLENKLYPYKEKRVEEVIKKLTSCPDIANCIKIIEENTFLTESEIKNILLNISLKLTQSVEEIVDSNPSEKINLRDYCEQKIAEVVDRKSWSFFEKYGITPIKTDSISVKSMDELTVYIEKLLSDRQAEKEKILKDAEVSLSKAKTIDEFNSIINSLQTIGDYKNTRELCNQASDERSVLSKKILDEISEEIDKCTSEEDLQSIEKKIDVIYKSKISTAEIRSKALSKKKELTTKKIEEENKRKQSESKKKKQSIVGKLCAVVVAIAIILSVSLILMTRYKYNEAEQLLKNGEVEKAAMTFAEVYYYSDSKERSFKLWNGIADRQTLSAGGDNTVACKTDGTVISVGDNYHNQNDIGHWTNIIAVSVSGHHTLGLKADGTVVAVGYNKDGQCNVKSWKNIVAISAGHNYSVGLKADGTVVAVGNNDDGQCDVAKWKNIVAISAGYSHTIGLKNDGTVVAVGSNTAHQCDVGDWTNIISVSAGDNNTFGVTAYGKVESIGTYENGRLYVYDWNDVVSISVGVHTVGLKSDGTVVAVGNNDDGQCDVSDWTDIVAISAGTGHIVGLKSNGAVVAAGNNSDYQCDVFNWTDIRISNK